MDTSETYIKMCEKAEEIQNSWKPEGGDWIVFDYRDTTKTSKEFEKQAWGDDDKTWKRVEVLCYQPSELKDWWIGTTGKESLVKSSQDLTKEHCVWLPRQDQLQEMVPTQIAGTKPNLKMISEFTHFFDYWDTNGIPINLTTWEQLWLAFVMKEKYNKVWDGEKWQTIK